VPIQNEMMSGSAACSIDQQAVQMLLRNDALLIPSSVAVVVGTICVQAFRHVNLLIDLLPS